MDWVSDTEARWDALRALERASGDQREVLILDEIGEMIAQDLLAPCWNEMLRDENQHRHLFARAVRDALADCLSTLPGFLAENNRPGFHFYFASLTPLRKSMFPQLEKAYRQWRENGSCEGLKSAVNDGQVHWLNTANRLTDDFTTGQAALNDTVQSYIEQHAL